jgi:ribonuclease P protein component
VLATGRTKSDNYLVLKTASGTGSVTRTGLVTSKKVGGAVERNRVRRRLREILRQTDLRPGMDIVFIARPPSKTAPFTVMETSVRGLLKRAGLIDAENEKTGSRFN